MLGRDENKIWVDEPITEVQRIILVALKFEIPECWSPPSLVMRRFRRKQDEHRHL
jgi:hypothetical protein